MLKKVAEQLPGKLHIACEKVAKTAENGLNKGFLVPLRLPE